MPADDWGRLCRGGRPACAGAAAGGAIVAAGLSVWGAAAGSDAGVSISARRQAANHLGHGLGLDRRRRDNRRCNDRNRFGLGGRSGRGCRHDRSGHVRSFAASSVVASVSADSSASFCGSSASAWRTSTGGAVSTAVLHAAAARRTTRAPSRPDRADHAHVVDDFVSQPFVATLLKNRLALDAELFCQLIDSNAFCQTDLLTNTS